MLYNAQDNTWNKLIADESDERFSTLLSIKDTPQNAQAIIDLLGETRNENNTGEQSIGESLYESIDKYQNVGRSNRNDGFNAKQQGTNGRDSELYRSESEGNGERDTRRGSSSKQGITKDDI